MKTEALVLSMRRFPRVPWKQAATTRVVLYIQYKITKIVLSHVLIFFDLGGGLTGVYRAGSSLDHRLSGALEGCLTKNCTKYRLQYVIHGVTFFRVQLKLVFDQFWACKSKSPGYDLIRDRAVNSSLRLISSHVWQASGMCRCARARCIFRRF